MKKTAACGAMALLVLLSRAAEASSCPGLSPFVPVKIRDIDGRSRVIERQSEYYFEEALFLLRETLQGLNRRAQDFRRVHESEIEDLLLDTIPLMVALDLGRTPEPWDRAVRTAVRQTLLGLRQTHLSGLSDRDWLISTDVRERLREQLYAAMRPM